MIKKTILRKFIFLLVAVLSCININAQNSPGCGCDYYGTEACLNDTLFTGGESLKICYEVTGLENNSLGVDQGICGVRVNFFHSFIYGLNISLISPEGQTIELVGPVIDLDISDEYGNTPSYWDVTFLPGSEPVSPDPTFQDQWSNAQVWEAGQIYNGTYWPSDLNLGLEGITGIGNGEWCIEVDNEILDNTDFGIIYDFEVIFCDVGGLPCCMADAGMLDYDPIDTIGCYGDTSLNLNVIPTNENGFPDPNYYGYQYLITDENGLILEISDDVDLVNYAPGSYMIFGISYLLDDVDYLNSLPTDATVNDILLAIDADPGFCADLSTDTISYTIEIPPVEFEEETTLCEGDTLEYLGEMITEAGLYEFIVENPAGCDGVGYLEVTLDTGSLELRTETICAGDSSTIDGVDFYTISDQYTVVYTNENGCDSMIRLDLTVLDPIIETRFDTICLGETLIVGGEEYTAPGDYQLILESELLCDSIININLVVEDVNALILGDQQLDCTNPTLSLDGSSSSGATNLNFEWSSFDGNITSSNDLEVIEVNEPGVYDLVVSTTYGCSDTSSINILEDVNYPEIIIDDYGLITCINGNVELDASASVFVNNGTFEWSTDDGSIISADTNAPAITVDLNGAYYLSITDVVNNCSATDTFVVDIDITAPPLSGATDTITCYEPSVPLQVLGDYAGPYSWEWLDPAGNIIDGSQNMPIYFSVNQGGTYTFQALNVDNGCTITDLVDIDIDTISPEVILNPVDELDCVNTSVLIDGSSSTALINYEVNWNGPPGGIESGAGTLSIVADEPGLYSMNYINLDNGCEDTDTIEVLSNEIYETLDPGADNLTLDCETTVIELGLAASNPIGVNFEYSWVNLINNNTTQGQLLEVDTAGFYEMQVLNTSNQCISTAIVEVESIQRDIIADATASNILTCDMPETDLIGSYMEVLTADINTITYTWLNSSGGLEGNESTITVNQGGVYTFVVFDEYSLCGDEVDIEVAKNTELPNPNAGPDVALDCYTGEATLTGTFSDDPSTHVSSWYNSEGNLISSDPFEVVVNEVGFYSFLVENETNGCSFEDIVEVFIDTVLCTPQLDSIPDVIVDCYNVPEVFGYIDATPYFDTSLGYTYSWNVIDGIIDGPDDGLIVKALIGDYTFEVTNPIFGLTYIDTIQIIDGRVYPDVEVQDEILLVNCAQLANNVELVGFEVNGINTMEYIWEAPDESNIVSGGNSTNCMVNAPGLYSFVGINTATGCLDAASVLVGLDGEYPPNSCLPDNLQFDCDSASIVVSIEDCFDPAFGYEWEILTGQILGPNDEAVVEVTIENSPSMLMLETTNLENLCTTVDTVSIFAQGQCFPTCEIDAPGVINCVQDTVELVALNSSTGADFVYTWVSDNVGDIVGPTDELTLQVVSDGFYTLFVTDTISGLSCSTTVQVEDDYSTIDAIINPIDGVNCYADSVNISFSVLENVPYSVSWITPSQNCEITEPFDGFYYTRCGGDYGLVISPDSTGCKDTIEFTVPLDTLRPLALLGSDTILDCLNPSLALLSTGSSSGEDYFYTFFNEDWDLINEGVSLPFATTTNAGVHALVVQDLESGCRDTSFYEVIDNANVFEADAGTYPLLDCDNPNLELQGSSNTLDNLIYYWEGDPDCFLTDPNSQSVTISCPGEYVLIVLDTVTGCDDVGYVTIEQDEDLPLADAGEDLSIECTDTSIFIDGTGSDVGTDIVYDWYTLNGNIIGSSTNPILEVDLEGTYYLVVTNSTTLCSDTSAVNVLNGTTFPLADAGPDLTIGCGSDFVQADGTNSTMGANYSWTTNNGNIVLGENSLTPTFDQAGEYVLLVELNDCIDQDTLLAIKDLTPPNANILSNSNYLNCVYDTLSLNGDSSSPQGFLEFNWSSNNTIVGDNENSSIQIIQPGIYTLNLTNVVNQCTSSVSIEIFESYAEPTLVYELPEELNCYNDVVVIDASTSTSDNGILAKLTGPANATIYNSSTLTPTVDTAGLYQLIIRDGFSLCADTVSVNVYENYDKPILELSSDPNVLCEVNDAILDMSTSLPLNNMTYEWYYNNIKLDNFDGDSIIAVNDLGEYYVVGESLLNGCTDTLNIEVGAIGNPILELVYSREELDCFGDSNGSVTIDSVIGGTAPYLYGFGELDLGSYAQFLYLTAGEYILEVEDIDGCKYEELVVFEDPEALKVSLGEDQYIRYGELAKIEADIESLNTIEKIEWSNIPFSANQLEVEVGPENTSIYDVLVIDDKLCEGRDSVIVYVDETPAIYVPNTFNPDGSYGNRVFGPLADDSVSLINTFKVYDRWGALVFEEQDFEPSLGSGWDGSFRGKKLQSGVFVWYLEASLQNGELIFMKGNVSLLR